MAKLRALEQVLDEHGEGTITLEARKFWFGVVGDVDRIFSATFFSPMVFALPVGSQESPKCVLWIGHRISECLICEYQCHSCCRLCHELVLDSEIEFLPEDSGRKRSPLTTDE